MIVRDALLLHARDLVDIELAEGRILRIAPAGALPSGPEVEDVSLDGRIILPGFWDEHVHLGMWAEYRRHVQLGSAKSAAEAAELMRTASPDPEAEVRIGVGFRDGLWPDAKSAALLDQHSGSTPWVLWSVDVHSVWLNSAALDLFGVDSAEGSGVLREGEAFALAERMAAIDERVRDQWVEDALAEAASRGVVGLVDFDFDDYQDRWLRRRPPGSNYLVEIEAAVYPDVLPRAIERGHRTGTVLAPGVTVGPLKAITDGSLNTRTARCVDHYLGVPDSERGQMNYTEQELRQLLSDAKAHGFVPALHAIGDEAVRTVLDLFEQSAMSGRMEHVQLVSRSDLPRFLELGVVASVQPQHAIDDRDVADRYWADRVDRVIALRELRDHGATLIFGSDAPVSPLDPLTQIAAAVARTDDDREPWQSAQRLEIGEALEASARSQIAIGEPADLVALSADPVWLSQAFGSRPSELSRAIRALDVELTVRGGVITHEAL